jgi:hypothetical protein
MRRLTTRIASVLLATFTLLSVACSGGGNSPSGPTTPTTPTPPTAPGAPTITAVSPTNPYYGDTITVTGTGFSATAATNHVWFRKLTGSCGSNTDTTARPIVSATTTQLRVIVPYLPPPETQFHPQNCLNGSVRVSVGGPSGESAPITFFAPPRIRRWTAADGTSIARAEQSVEIAVDGLNPDSTANTIVVNGATISPSLISDQIGPNPPNGLGSVQFTLPSNTAVSVGGVSINDTATVPVSVTIRGRVANASLLMRRYAPVHIDSVRVVLVPQATPGAPDSPEVRVWVRNFFGPVEARWTRVGQTAAAGSANLGLDGLTNGAIIFGPPTGLTTGSYNISLRVTRFATPQVYNLSTPVTVP